MKLKRRNAPHISIAESSRSLMLSVIIILMVIYGMSFFFYGVRAIILGLVGAVSAVLTDWLCLWISGKKPNIHELSPIVTGLIIPLLLPAAVPFRIVVIASIFAISVAKYPFGGMGHNIFNPAAAGAAFVMTCYPSSIMFRYTAPLTKLPIFITEELTAAVSPAFTLSIGGLPNYDPVKMAFGNFPGPMGATNILVIVACLLFLISRRAVKWQTPVFFLATVAAIAAIFPRAPISPIESVIYEVMSGFILFGAVFMLTDPVTSPKRSWANIAYGIVAGIIVMLFRHNAKMEESFVFALLFMNSLVWGFDSVSEHIAHQLRRRKYARVIKK